MRRLAVPLAFLAATGVIAAGATLVLEARDADTTAAPRRPTALMRVVSASVRPAAHAFGEPVVAELVLVADATAVVLDTVRVDAEFAPHEAAGPHQVRRTVSGARARFRFRWPLRCLREGCAPDGERRSFQFPLANVVYRLRPNVVDRLRAAPGPASALVEWPSFQVTGDVDDESLRLRAWRADQASLPEVSYRWSPGALAAGLLGAAAALAALGVGLAWWLVRRRDDVETVEEEDHGPTHTPLERALELARQASRNGASPDRRRALERVARELGLHGHAELADRARALAWAAGDADPAAVDDLAQRVRAATNGDAT